MEIKRDIIGGLAGAIALNIVHETLRQFIPEAPHIHVLGEDALSKGMQKMKLTPPSGKALYISTLAGDIISNSIYFSLIGKLGKKNLLLTGLTFGLAAGSGALLLSKPLGLNDATVNRTVKTKAMTVGYY